MRMSMHYQKSNQNQNQPPTTRAPLIEHSVFVRLLIGSSTQQTHDLNIYFPFVQYKILVHIFYFIF